MYDKLKMRMEAEWKLLNVCICMEVFYEKWYITDLDQILCSRKMKYVTAIFLIS